MVGLFKWFKMNNKEKKEYTIRRAEKVWAVYTYEITATSEKEALERLENYDFDDCQGYDSDLEDTGEYGEAEVTNVRVINPKLSSVSVPIPVSEVENVLELLKEKGYEAKKNI